MPLGDEAGAPSVAGGGAPSGAKQLEETLGGAAMTFPCRFGILALRRHGIVVLAPGISARSMQTVRDAERASGRTGLDEERERVMQETLRDLRQRFGAERVRDLRHLGPLHIPSGYEDDFNFSKHVLARIAGRCVDGAALERVLGAAARTHRTFRDAVEASYRPGDLRRCRAIDLDQDPVFPYHQSCLDRNDLARLFQTR